MWKFQELIHCYERILKFVVSNFSCAPGDGTEVPDYERVAITYVTV